MKNSRASLVKSEKFLIDIINHMVDPVFVKDDASRLLLVNDAFCNIFEISKEFVIGKTLAEHVPENERRQFLKVDFDVLSTGKEDIREETLTINGKTSVIQTKKNLFVSDTGERYLLGSIHDITNIKEVEKATIESQRLQAMGEMSSSIAHDFNNALQVLMSNLETSKLKTIIPPNISTTFDKIESIVFDIKERVNSLQKFGEINNGKTSNENNDINQLILKTIDELQPLWKDEMERKSKSIEILTDLKAVGLININKGDLKTILYNLIKNSIESFKDQKDGLIKIVTKNENQKIILSIEDSGCGMTEVLADKIFQPFFTTKGINKGRGLGLSGVYGLLKSAGGDIAVKQTIIDMGTIFKVSLPINNDKQKQEEQNKTQLIGGKNILWVEDDAIIGMNTQMLVESLGYNCEIAESADEAINMIKGGSFDFVISDVGLGGMNGLELAKYISNNHNNIKIAIASGWIISEEEKKEHGVICSISKPFSKLNLMDCISKLETS